MSRTLTPPSGPCPWTDMPILLSFCLKPKRRALERMVKTMADRALDDYASDPHGRSLDWHAGSVSAVVTLDPDMPLTQLLSEGVAEIAREFATDGRARLLPEQVL